VPAQRYRDGSAGRSKWDVVHLIPLGIQVLQGRVPEQNERRITKPVALILLAHYVADIHQLLHVGAEYFDQQGRVVDPDKDKSALGDEGGNTFTLKLSDDPPRRRGIHKKKFHGFWDSDAVNELFLQGPGTLRKREVQGLIEPQKKELVHEMATHQPNHWRMLPSVPIDSYAEIWADEILPIARQAYARLQFTHVHLQREEDRIVAAGNAVERTNSDLMNYRRWATGVVRQELHKAGWRLANLLEKIL
jgi:S1/P1 Nuclease